MVSQNPIMQQAVENGLGERKKCRRRRERATTGASWSVRYQRYPYLTRRAGWERRLINGSTFCTLTKKDVRVVCIFTARAGIGNTAQHNPVHRHHMHIILKVHILTCLLNLPIKRTQDKNYRLLSRWTKIAIFFFLSISSSAFFWLFKRL